MRKVYRKERSKWQVGMTVTVSEEVSAYYSAYAGRPAQSFRPDMIGVIGAVEVPRISRYMDKYRQGRQKRYLDDGPYFVCVDFIGDDGEKWRAGVDYSNLVLKEKT